MTTTTSDTRVYLVGGGIASLAAAVFLIRDAGLHGENIRILEELPVVGGALDGTGDPGRGFVARGGRMLEEEAYVCLWDLLETIPTLTDPDKTVKDEVWEFSRKWSSHAGARLIDRDHKILDAADLGLDLRDKAELVRLLALPEHVIGARRIDEFFSDHFFATNFWAMWRTTFAFQNWHSAIELKRYMLRFAQELPRIHTPAGVRRTRLHQYDSIVRPIQQWLADRGVVTEHGTTVTDADFTGDAVSGRRITALRVVRDGRPGTYELGEHDYAFLTLGSMTADAAYGADDRAPELIRDKRDGAFRLWEAIARKAPDFGRPNTFCGRTPRRHPLRALQHRRGAGHHPGQPQHRCHMGRRRPPGVPGADLVGARGDGRVLRRLRRAAGALGPPGRTSRTGAHGGGLMTGNMTAAPVGGLVATPLSAACADVLAQAEHACIGVGPFNSYFSVGRIRQIAQWAYERFAQVDFFVPDGPSAYTLQALGYPPERAEWKARRQGQ
ncbi:oleate hydratase [Streptomyces sp. NPDC058755]|uniref:oleate hydratase n=1 Tax=Streptomyces sp. NPDC058755 TaxID=3346624 RepID=UPI0036CC3585